MKRMLLLVTVALMLAGAMALSGVAQARPIADSPDAKCAKLAIKTLGPSVNPSNYTFIGGTEGHDVFTGTAGPEVFCGFGSVDQIDTLAAGDIFLGGADVDIVSDNFGTYYGGAGDDAVLGTNERGATFYGGEGDDSVHGLNSGTFYGGAGNDRVNTNTPSGTFYGQEGDDHVQRNLGGFNERGFFDGGDGTDSVGTNEGGTIINVP